MLPCRVFLVRTHFTHIIGYVSEMINLKLLTFYTKLNDVVLSPMSHFVHDICECPSVGDRVVVAIELPSTQ